MVVIVLFLLRFFCTYCEYEYAVLTVESIAAALKVFNETLSKRCISTHYLKFFSTLSRSAWSFFEASLKQLPTPDR